MLQNTTKLSRGYAVDDKKEAEEYIESSIFRNSNYYIKKKRKYPFYQHIDKAIDPELKAIFAETYDYISHFVATEDKNIDQTINKLQDDESQTHTHIHPLVDDEEKDIILDDKQLTKQLGDEVNDTNDTFPSIMPLTEAQIRKELNFSSNVANVSKSTLNEYQEKVIETITKEFEKINFRSPSQQEISIILTKSINKVQTRINPQRPRRLTKNQQLLALNASKGSPTDVLFNSRKVVLDYLVHNLRNKENKISNEDNQDFLHNVLMFKVRQNSDL
mmetsp:Transcript_12279/g.10911  ORF Transcript_12279/g.10911 Transcript_12279/m.10911 type:complete len:275 (-) Transcript_12279:89-913(-)